MLQKQISKANSELTVKHAELAALFLKVMHLQKILNQMNCCALQKADCLAAELNSNNNEINDEVNSLNIQQLVNLMFFFF